jgi:hypothetical protein
VLSYTIAEAGDIAPHGLGRLSYRFAQRAIAVH